MKARQAGWLILGAGALLGGGWPRRAPAQAADLPFGRYTTEQGLSNNEVTALARDQRGFLWVGTVNGLNRFDGVQVKVFKRTGRADGLPGNYVVRGGLTPDPRGYLWVATNRGLCRFDPVREQGLTLPLPQLRDRQADNDFVSPLHFDRAGQGWFASASHLHQLDPRTLRLRSYPLPYQAPNHFPEPFFDAAGNLWLLSQSAVYRFEPATRRYTYCQGRDQVHPQGRPEFNGLYADGRGTWYAATQQGLHRYDAATGRFTRCAAGPGAVAVLAEGPGPAGQPGLWLGGVGQLGRYEPGRPLQASFRYQAENPYSYPGGLVLSLLPNSRTGNLWVGTSQGLATLDSYANKFGLQLLPAAAQPDGTETVQRVVQDARRDSLYWVLTRQAGLWCWQRPRGRLLRVGRPPAVPGPAFDALPDAQGRLWVSFEGALASYDPARQRWQVHRRWAGPSAARPGEPAPLGLRALCRDQQQRLWVATEQGLCWFDPGRDLLVPYEFPAAIGPVGTVRRLQEDAWGRLWVLTSQGLLRLAADRRQVQRIELGPLVADVQLSNQLQSTFLLDRAGRIWLSGIDFVVQADSGGRVQHTYTLRNGLRADHTFGLAEAADGHVWLATDEQLHELNPATGQFRYYDKASGLLTNSRQPFTSSRQGELFLGGAGGFNYFHPGRLRRNPLPPPVALTDIQVNNQPRSLRPDAPLTLRPGETTLTVGFTALNFSQATKNRYAYRLEGFDRGWTETEARSVTYTNLAPGTYALRIRAANNDGVWNRAGQTLTVQVQPAYYQTGWFKAGLLLAAAAVLGGVYRYRQAQRRHLARVRDDIAKDLHDDIGSTLSSIRIFSEVAQGQLGGEHTQARALMQRISQNASTLAESMQDIIWTIKPQQDGLADLVSRMREFGLRLTEARGIAFAMQVAEPFPVRQLSLEQRRALYLIFKESVNNAVKYADCSTLTVSLALSGRQLHLRIADDGRGFDPATARAGNGLANLQARARDIGGRVQLTSAPAAGTCVALVAPLR